MPVDHPDKVVQGQLLVLYQMIANGNEEAFKFIIAWNHYVHNIDDQVDGDKNNMKGVEDIASNYLNAWAIYTSKFWRDNQAGLFLLVPLITNDYISSENNTKLQHLRHNGNLMLKAVAYITGDWPLLRQVSPLIDQLSSEQQTTSITI